MTHPSDRGDGGALDPLGNDAAAAARAGDRANAGAAGSRGDDAAASARAGGDALVPAPPHGAPESATPPIRASESAPAPSGASESATPPNGALESAPPLTRARESASPSSRASESAPPIRASEPATPPTRASEPATPPSGASESATPPSGASESAPAPNGAPERGRYFVEALGRGLALLDCFVRGPAQLTLAELSEAVGLSKGTTFRLLRTLEEAGYLRQDPLTKRYQLSLKLLDFHDPSLAALEYPLVAQPYLEELNQALGESVNMAVLEGSQVRYVARVAAKRIMSVNLHVGSTLPAHATSMGKVLLAALGSERVRALYADRRLERHTPRTIGSVDDLLAELGAVDWRGWALAEEELEPGLRSAAAPVRGPTGRVVAAVNVSTATARVTREELVEQFVPALLRTTAAISLRLGFRERSAALAR